MKKNIFIIILIIIISVLVALILINKDIIYKKIESKANILIEDMKNKKEIYENQKKGYIVLKDGSVRKKIKEEDNLVTLISAYPLNEKGKIDSKNPYLISYNNDCYDDCDINRKGSDLVSFISKKFLEPLINVLGREESEGIVTRQITMDDLKLLGCDTDNLNCNNAPNWLSEYPFWTSITVDGTNNVFIIDKDKKIKEYEAYEKAYLRVVLITDKKNIY